MRGYEIYDLSCSLLGGFFPDVSEEDFSGIDIKFLFYNFTSIPDSELGNLTCHHRNTNIVFSICNVLLNIGS